MDPRGVIWISFSWEGWAELDSKLCRSIDSSETNERRSLFEQRKVLAVNPALI